MRYVLQLAMLLAAFASSTAFGADRIRLAQQVAPTPLTPTPLLSSPTSTACLVGCDTQVMNCQNACVIVGPATGAPNPAGTASCTLNCTTQQLVCKQACNRTPQ
jgi:hypothetical protein